MKKIALSLLLFVTTACLYAQQTISADDYFQKQKSGDEEKIQTLMNSFEIKRLSGFGGPTMSFTSIKDEFAFMMGGGGGLIINNIYLGGYGEDLSTSLYTGMDNPIRNLEFGHGGFWLGYEIAHHRVIHPVVSARIGWGEIAGIDVNNKRIRDNVFVLVPTVSAEINFTRFFKVNIGAEYRQTFNVNTIPGFSSKDFSNPGVFVSFVFGWF